MGVVDIVEKNSQQDILSLNASVGFRLRTECFLEHGNLTRETLMNKIFERTQQWNQVFELLRRKSIESRQDIYDLDAGQGNERVG